VTGRSREELGLHLVYDVAHNIAKIERHRMNGGEITVCVHRKGATRAFPAGHPEVPPKYRAVGQPVLVPGDMARYSFLAVGTPRAMEETWGSTCHGAGRVRSRGAAKRLLAGVNVAERMAQRGIVVRAQNPRALAEEASEAYKDVANVIDVLERAGISRKVARMRPIGVIKG
jgi:tRNA-splicing ligase RtcB